jgi:sec-independent protein translocase protein TatB
VFDIGFSELIVCALVALIVIGPERMPEAVRTVGLWVGRLKRSLRDTRAEIERQMGMDDIRRQLHNEEILRSLEEARRELDEAVAQNQNLIHGSLQPDTQPTIAPDAAYTSEPELPYHSHMDEQPAKPTPKAPATAAPAAVPAGTATATATAPEGTEPTQGSKAPS